MKKKQAIAFLLSVAMTTGVSIPVFGSDIDGHWAQATIAKWKNNGKINGYQDGSFQPDKSITRAEFLRLLNRTMQTSFSSTEAIQFSDVQQQDWFYQDVTQAFHNKITNGFADGTFRPNEPITRAQAAMMISSAKGLSANETAANHFQDKIPTWAKGAVGAVVAADYLVGYADDTFGADKNMTRAEAVSALDRVEEQETPLPDVITEDIIIYDQAGLDMLQGKKVLGKTFLYVQEDLTLSNIEFVGEVIFIPEILEEEQEPTEEVAAAYIGADTAVKRAYEPKKVHNRINMKGNGRIKVDNTKIANVTIKGGDKAKLTMTSKDKDKVSINNLQIDRYVDMVDAVKDAMNNIAVKSPVIVVNTDTVKVKVNKDAAKIEVKENKDNTTEENKDNTTEENKDGTTEENKDGTTEENKDNTTEENKDNTNKMTIQDANKITIQDKIESANKAADKGDDNTTEEQEVNLELENLNVGNLIIAPSVPDSINDKMKDYALGLNNTTINNASIGENAGATTISLKNNSQLNQLSNKNSEQTNITLDKESILSKLSAESSTGRTIISGNGTIERIEAADPSKIDTSNLSTPANVSPLGGKSSSSRRSTGHTQSSGDTPTTPPTPPITPTQPTEVKTVTLTGLKDLKVSEAATAKITTEDTGYEVGKITWKKNNVAVSDWTIAEAGEYEASVTLTAKANHKFTAPDVTLNGIANKNYTLGENNTTLTLTTTVELAENTPVTPTEPTEIKTVALTGLKDLKVSEAATAKITTEDTGYGIGEITWTKDGKAVDWKTAEAGEYEASVTLTAKENYKFTAPDVTLNGIANKNYTLGENNTTLTLTTTVELAENTPVTPTEPVEITTVTLTGLKDLKVSEAATANITTEDTGYGIGEITWKKGNVEVSDWTKAEAGEYEASVTLTAKENYKFVTPDVTLNGIANKNYTLGENNTTLTLTTTVELAEDTPPVTPTEPTEIAAVTLTSTPATLTGLKVSGAKDVEITTTDTSYTVDTITWTKKGEQTSVTDWTKATAGTYEMSIQLTAQTGYAFAAETVVKLNGTTLTKDKDYTLVNGTLTVTKEVTLEAEDPAITSFTITIPEENTGTPLNSVVIKDRANVENIQLVANVSNAADDGKVKFWVTANANTAGVNFSSVKNTDTIENNGATTGQVFAEVAIDQGVAETALSITGEQQHDFTITAQYLDKDGKEVEGVAKSIDVIVMHNPITRILINKMPAYPSVGDTIPTNLEVKEMVGVIENKGYRIDSAEIGNFTSSGFEALGAEETEFQEKTKSYYALKVVLSAITEANFDNITDKTQIEIVGNENSNAIQQVSSVTLNNDGTLEILFTFQPKSNKS